MQKKQFNPYGYKVGYREIGSRLFIRQFITKTYRQAHRSLLFYRKYGHAGCHKKDIERFNYSISPRGIGGKGCGVGEGIDVHTLDGHALLGLIGNTAAGVGVNVGNRLLAAKPELDVLKLFGRGRALAVDHGKVGIQLFVHRALGIPVFVNGALGGDLVGHRHNGIAAADRGRTVLQNDLIAIGNVERIARHGRVGGKDHARLVLHGGLVLGGDGGRLTRKEEGGNHVVHRLLVTLEVGLFARGDLGRCGVGQKVQGIPDGGKILLELVFLAADLALIGARDGRLAAKEGVVVLADERKALEHRGKLAGACLKVGDRIGNPVDRHQREVRVVDRGHVHHRDACRGLHRPLLGDKQGIAVTDLANAHILGHGERGIVGCTVTGGKREDHGDKKEKRYERFFHFGLLCIHIAARRSVPLSPPRAAAPRPTGEVARKA